MHSVILYLLFLDGAEGSEPDVKQNGRDRSSLLTDAVEKLRRKVKPRRRRRRRSLLARIDRLVPFAVLKLFRDVRRKRHRSDPMQCIVNGLRVLSRRKMHKAVAVRHHRFYLRAEYAVSEFEDIPRHCTLARSGESLPFIAAALSQKKQLDRSFRRGGKVSRRSLRRVEHAVSDYTRGKHSRVVYDQHVLRTYVFRYIAEDPMLDALFRTVDHHKARGIPRFDRMLRYPFLREGVCEIFK